MRAANQTLLQFPVAVPGAASTPPAQALQRATVCTTCAQRFSSDSRFCPFDGQSLAVATVWDPSGDPLIGTVIDDRYLVERAVGEGGMGIVYAVRHAALGKRFALKALRGDLWSDPQVAARFVQEARAAASVRHPGLVEITDFGRLSSGQAYFVMEYLEGQPLSQLLRQAGRLSAPRAIDIARQAAEALCAAHQGGIVHRDLKPGNIHMDPGAGFGERVKVVDFGLAHVAGSSRLTRAGIVYGTPHYMSPEQAAGKIADPRSDIYSLGVVMYEMITGRVPFEADTYLGVLSMHMYTAPEHPRKFAPDCAGFGALENVILRCLEKNPANRYESLTALIGDLLSLEQPSEASAVRSRRSVDPSSVPLLIAGELAAPSRAALNVALPDIPVRSNPLWIKLAVVLAAFVASVLFAFAFRPKREAAQGSAPNAAATQPPVKVEKVAGPERDGPAPPVSSGGATGSTSQSSAVAAVSRRVSSAHAARRVFAESAQKRSARSSVKGLGASEILDPWGK